MRLSFRWYGPDDPVRLDQIRQIPGVTGIVTSLHHLPPGAAWRDDDLAEVVGTVESHGLSVSAIESLPVPERVKYGHPERDRDLDAYAQSLEAIGRAGISVVCYNFMPVFDWLRTDLAFALPDGSTALAYDERAIRNATLFEGAGGLPGWHAVFGPGELAALRAAYSGVDEVRLWDHLAYFLEAVVPVAEAAGVRLALHPDDPPWPILGLPRIITSAEALLQVTKLVDRPANGITLCTGSLRADSSIDLPRLVAVLGPRIHFAHLRDVVVTGPRQFHETAHGQGDADLPAIVEALVAARFEGPIRPDHGRMIWAEIGDARGRPGYGLYDRALGASYLRGLWDATLRRARTLSLQTSHHA